jgi:antitoxin PrlF
VADHQLGALVLHPAAVVAVETYSDEQIARWDEDDRLGDAERAEIVARLSVRV